MRHDNLGYHFTVVVDNGFKDREFVLRNEKEVQQFGISLASVKGVLYGWSTTVYGMEVRRISLSHTPTTMYDYQDIKRLFKINKQYFSLIAIPIVGKVIEEGKYFNTQFSFFSHHEHDCCFNKHQVKMALIDPLFSHRGCIFKVTTPKEAISVHANLTPDLIDYLKTHFSGRGCNRQLMENKWNS